MIYESTHIFTVPSRSASIIKWSISHLLVYVAVALLSAALFFVGATAYVYLWRSPDALAPTLTRSPIEMPLKPIAKPEQNLRHEGELVVSANPRLEKLVSKFQKRPIYDKNNSEIGYVADFLADKEGKVTGVLVSIPNDSAWKTVAFPLNLFSFIDDKNSPRVEFLSNRDALSTGQVYTFDKAFGAWTPSK